MKDRIYYFTGAGNTLKVAKEIADGMGNTELIRISSETMPEKGSNELERVGIFFPIYMGRPPRFVREFIAKLDLAQETYIYTVMTCDAHIGESNLIVQEILQSSHGLKLSGNHTVLMPATNMTRRAPETKEEQEAYFVRVRKQLPGVIESVRQKAIIGIPDVPQEMRDRCEEADAIFAPYASDVSFYAEDCCVSCGTCVKVCPAANIRLTEGRPEWLHRCERCTACLQLCPVQAIQFKEQTKEWGRYHNPDIKISELFIPGREGLL